MVNDESTAVRIGKVNGESTVVRIGNIVVLVVICVCGLLAVIRLLLAHQTGSYDDIDAMHLVQAGLTGELTMNELNDVSASTRWKNPANNITMIRSIVGKNWTDLNQMQRQFLIKRWLCKKRNCNQT
jgi:hypothetical protein